MAIASGGLTVQKQVDRLNIDGYFGSTGKTNVQGEDVQKLDESGNKVFIDSFKMWRGCYGGLRRVRWS